MFFGGNLSWVYVKVTWVKDPTIFALSCMFTEWQKNSMLAY